MTPADGHPVTFVTALCRAYADNDAVRDRLLRDFRVLAAELGDRLIVFADDYYHPLIAGAPVRTLVRMPLQELSIYNEIIARGPRLPRVRNVPKDTLEYLALVNSKIEFLVKALEYTDDDVAWIDAGVNKVFRHPDLAYRHLRAAVHDPRYDVIVPGCHSEPYTRADLLDHVRWNYLGALLMVRRSFAAELMQRSLRSVRRFLAVGVITWEVNVWIDVFQTEPADVLWYVADHDDSLAFVPPPAFTLTP